jgi:hypothetical protein
MHRRLQVARVAWRAAYMREQGPIAKNRSDNAANAEVALNPARKDD